jgi:membrane-bound lytic murein transglycosylase MltF
MFTIIDKKKSLVLFLILCVLWPISEAKAFDDTLTREELLAQNVVLKGDFDAMKKTRRIRVLIPSNRAFFFFDGVQPKGISYEQAVHFEKFINNKVKTKTIKVKILIIPTPREELFSRLQAGLGDIAMGNLTITDERRQIVDFSAPFADNVSEILVTNKKQSALTKLFDLSGMEVHVRKSSSYYESLIRLNEVLKIAEKKPVKIVEADDRLEDSDLLEMMNADLIPAIIIDDHKGKLWKQVFKNIRLHPEVKVNSGGQIAWAIRKNSPKLKAVINEFVKKNKAGTLHGNVLINRYLKNAKYITKSTGGIEMKRFRNAVDFFKEYGEKYQFDYLMLAALAFQESRLDHSLKSKAGAIGVMQILPSTAKDQNVGIPNIEKIDPNIHAGTKYLRFMADRYFSEDSGIDTLNRVFFTFAAYNAGPGKVAKLRKEAKEMGLNPNVWFNNVEVVAAKRIGRETVQYVSNIFKYYVAYKLLGEKALQPEVK